MNKKQACFLISLFAFAFALGTTATSLELSEVMYNPNGTDTGREWVEIHTGEELNISKVRFFDNEGTHTLSLVSGSFLLDAGSYAVITSNAASFLTDYPGYEGTLFQASFSLSNTGEEIGLYNTTSTVIIDAYNYTNGFANGNGMTIEKIDGIWQESTELGGTPGYGSETQQIPEFSTGVFIATFLLGILVFFVVRKR